MSHMGTGVEIGPKLVYFSTNTILYRLVLRLKFGDSCGKISTQPGS